MFPEENCFYIKPFQQIPVNFAYPNHYQSSDNFQLVHV